MNTTLNYDDGTDTSMYCQNYTPTPMQHRIKPHKETHPNPIKDAVFTHYEIQTVREFISPDGSERFFQPVMDEIDCDPLNPLAVTDIMFAIYGRKTDGTCEHIADRKTLSNARETLKNAGII